MAYRVEVGLRADVQLSELDRAVGAAIERKIIWLAEDAPAMIPHCCAAEAKRVNEAADYPD